MNGDRNNKMVPVVYFLCSSGGSPYSLYNFNKSNSSYYWIKFLLLQVAENVWSNSKRCCICNLKWASNPLVPLYDAELLRQYNCWDVLLPLICPYPQTQASWQDKWKLLQQTERVTANISVIPIGQLLHWSLIHEKCNGCTLGSRWEKEMAWDPTMRWHTMFNSSRPSHHNSFYAFLPVNRCEHWGR